MRRFEKPASPHIVLTGIATRRLRVYMLLLLAAWVLAGCGREALDYGFKIKKAAIRQGYQSFNINLNHELNLSWQARAALRHGVTLTIRLDLELCSDTDMIVVKRLARRFEIRYLPLSERFQLSTDVSDNVRVFPRLRHVLLAINRLDVELPTGALPPGAYELRARILLDESRLPGPMQLPALFSSQWRHDSEWSVWPVNPGA